MMYVIVGAVAFVLGAWVVFAALERRRSESRRDRDLAERRSEEARAALAKAERDAQGAAAALSRLESEQALFDARAVPLRALEQENRVLKRDILNVGTTIRKLELDRQLQAEAQTVLDQKSHELAERYLAEVEKWVG